MIDTNNKLINLYLWTAKDDGSFFLGVCFLFPRSNPFEFGIDRDWGTGDIDYYGPYYFYIEYLGRVDRYGQPKGPKPKTWKFTLPAWIAKRLP